MLLLPLGVENAPPGRWPWMTAILVLACVTVHVLQPAPEDTTEASDASEARMMLYWKEHPYLVPSEGMQRFFSAAQIKQSERAFDEALVRSTLPSEELLEQEQAAFRALMVEHLNANSSRSKLDWAYVPRNGVWQSGLVTSLFLHSSWNHLIGNMIFLLLAAPLVEGIVGPWALLILFTLGGALVSLLDLALGTSAALANNLGASGSICLLEGLFIVRLWRTRVRLLIGLFGFYSRLVLVPAWGYGLYALGTQFVYLWRFGANTSVGYFTHVVGYVIGGTLGIVLLATGLEKRWTKPIRDGERLWHDDAEFTAAHAALTRRDYLGARSLFQRVLDRRPTSIQAAWGLAQSLVALGHAVSATPLLDRVFRHWLTTRDEVSLTQAIETLGDKLDPTQLSPGRAFQLGPALERVSHSRARQAYAHAAQAGVVAARVRLAELQLIDCDEDASVNARWALQAPDLTPALAVRARRVLEAAFTRSGWMHA